MLHAMRSVLLLAICSTPLFAAANGSITAIDAAGNVWRTGATGFMTTTSTAFQKTAGFGVCGTENISPFQSPVTLTCQHAFLTRQDATGNVLYATYLAGSSQDAGTALTTDSQGNVYVTGYTYSPDFPVTPGVVQAKNAGPTTPHQYTALGAPYGPANVVGGGDLFVAKFGPDGTLLFSTFLGGSGSDVPTLIAVDPSGSIYISGVTQSTDFPIAPAALTSQAAGNFFVRLNATGTALTYSAYFLSQVLAFDVDAQGRAYLTGDSVQADGSLSVKPFVTILDTTTGNIVNSIVLSTLKPNLTGAGVAIARNAAQNLMVAVSPAPLQPYNFYDGRPLLFSPGDSYLFELRSDAGAILAEIDIAHTTFQSILLDSAGNAYAFGAGTALLPKTAIQLLASPCSQNVSPFVLQTDPAGALLTATYLRQGDGTALAVSSPSHLLAYRAASTSTISIDLSTQPTALFGCPANLASDVSNAGVAPGEIISIEGAGLGPAQGIGAVPDANGLYPTSLGGVQVLFNSKPVPLLYVSATEIHAAVPFSIFNPAIQLQKGAQTIAPLDVRSADVNPGVFSVNGQGAIINQDGTVNAPANPAKLGSIVSVYCTGAGYLETPVTDGSVTAIPPPFNTTQFPQRIQFAGLAGTILWSGAAPGIIAGVTQINVQLPATLPLNTTLSAVPMVLESDGQFSPAVSISVKQ